MKKNISYLLAILFLLLAAVSLIGPVSAEEHSITISVSPAGAGVVDVSQLPPYNIDDEITMEGIAAPGYEFSSWEDSLVVFNGTDNPITEKVAGDHIVVAHFDPIIPTCFTLTLSATPPAGGIVSAPPANATCPSANQYLEGATINVSTSANLGYQFTGWSGDLPSGASGDELNLEVVMDKHRTLTAGFAEACQVLTLSRNSELGGTIPSADPLKRSCPNPYEFITGESTELTAEAATGWKITSWDIGDTNIPTSSGTYDLVMDPLPAGQGLLAQVNYEEKATFGFETDTTSVEEDSGKIDIKVVRKANTLPDAATIQFKTVDDDAKAGLDYTGKTGEIEFDKGEDEEIISIKIEPDNIKEGVESFFVELSKTSPNIKLDISEIEVQIIDDEGTPTIRFEEPVYIVGEEETTVDVTVTVSPLPQSGDVYVDFETKERTATAGEDYTSISDKTLRIRVTSGQTKKNVRITLKPDDLDEPDVETVLLELSSPSANAVLAEDPTAELRIADDDEPPAVAFSMEEYFIKKAGNSEASIPVILSAPSGREVEVEYKVTLERTGDTILEGTLAFDELDETETLDVPITAAVEDDIFNLQLSNPLNAELGTMNVARLYILSTNINDCNALTFSFSGYGQAPAAISKASSLGCPDGQYVAGELVDIIAQPQPGWYVSAWQGTIDDESLELQNALEMPNSPYSVNADYRVPIFFAVVSTAEPAYEGPNEEEPNNLFSQANGPIRFSKDYFGNFPTEQDTDDRYYFVLDHTADIYITLKDIPADKDYDIFLYNDNWRVEGVKDQSTLGKGKDEEIHYTAPAGIYYLRILTDINVSTPTTLSYRLRVEEQ